MCVYSVDRLVLPIQDALGHKVDISFTCFVLGVLDYVAADALKVAGNFIKNTRDRSQDNPRGGVIQERDLRVSINVDQVRILILLHVKRFCKIEQSSLSVVVWIKNETESYFCNSYTFVHDTMAEIFKPYSFIVAYCNSRFLKLHL